MRRRWLVVVIGVVAVLIAAVVLAVRDSRPTPAPRTPASAPETAGPESTPDTVRPRVPRTTPGRAGATVDEDTEARFGVVRGRVEDADGVAVADSAVAIMGRRTESDADGSFELRNFPPGKSRPIWVLHPDHGAGGSVVEEVVAGETTDVVVRLPAARKVVVNVRVLDPRGSPIPGAQVHVHLALDRRPSNQPTLGTVVSAVAGGGPLPARVRDEIRPVTSWQDCTDGSFSFEVDATARGLSLEARAKGYMTPLRRRVTIDDWDETEQDITLRPIERFAGRVVDRETGLPIAGARLYPRDPDITDRAPPHVETDAAGRFEVEQTTVLQNAVYVRAAGYLRLAWRLELARELGTLKLPRSHELQGRVALRDGTPIENASVRLEPNPFAPANGRPFTYGAGRTATDAEGRFTLHLGVGDVRLAVGPRVDSSVRFVPLQRAVSIPRDRNIEILVERGFGISGTVVDGDGNHVAGAHLTASPHSRTIGRVMHATSAADGRFSIEGLVNIVYAVDVSFPSGHVKRRYRKQTVASVAPGTTGLTITVESGAKMTGTVVDGDGKPVAGREVLVLTGDAPRHGHQSGPGAKTDASGAFVIEGLEPGACRVVLKSRAPDWSRCYLDGGEQLSAPAEGLRLVLSRGPRISGTVVDAGGSPLPGAGIDVLRMTDERQWDGRARADAQGRFAVHGLHPLGRYTVRVAAKGKAWIDVEDVAAGTHDLRVRLEEAE